MLSFSSFLTHLLPPCSLCRVLGSSTFWAAARCTLEPQTWQPSAGAAGSFRMLVKLTAAVVTFVAVTAVIGVTQAIAVPSRLLLRSPSQVRSLQAAPLCRIHVPWHDQLTPPRCRPFVCSGLASSGAVQQDVRVSRACFDRYGKWLLEGHPVRMMKRIEDRKQQPLHTPWNLGVFDALVIADRQAGDAGGWRPATAPSAVPMILSLVFVLGHTAWSLEVLAHRPAVDTTAWRTGTAVPAALLTRLLVLHAFAFVVECGATCACRQLSGRKAFNC